MDDVVLMAVVHAGKHLLDQKGGIALRKLTTSKDLIEELATLADLLHDVVSFVIFEEFEHLHNVGVIQFLENVDLVEEHATFVFVHVRLAEHFDGTLSCGLTVHAHSYLAKCTVAQHFTNAVKVTQFALIFLNDVLGSDINLCFNHNNTAGILYC